MLEPTRALLRMLRTHRIIGGKHTPEKRVLRMINHLPRHDQFNVHVEWEYCIKQLQWIHRMKKTGEWHVSLNPEKLAEVEHEIA